MSLVVLEHVDIQFPGETGTPLGMSRDGVEASEMGPEARTR